MAESKVITRTYTIPLRAGYANTPRYKRTNKAVRVLKAFLVKHMKSEDVKIGPQLNNLLWQNGIKNPPSKVTVDVSKDADNVVRAELSGVAYVDFKQQEKEQAPKNLQDKIKKTVEDAKAGSKKDSKEEKTEETKETPAVKEEKKAETPTEKAKPVEKKEEAPKAEAEKKAE